MSKNELSQSPKDTKPFWAKRWLKELVSLLGVMALLSVGVNLYYTQDMPNGVAPTIIGTTLDGLPVNVNELSKDKPVIVYFWATWCGACKWVSPSIDRLASEHQVVSIALSSGNDSRITQFMAAKQYQFPVLNDQSGHYSQDWQVRVTPTVVIVKDGQISSISTGVTSPFGLWLRTLFH